MATESTPVGPAVATEHPRFRAILENTFDVIVILDAQGRIAYESPSIARVLGYAPEERRDKPASELVHPDDVAAMSLKFAAMVAGNTERDESEVRARHKDGHWVTMQSTVINMLADPAVRGIVTVSRDVTEQRAAEEARTRALGNERLARTEAERTLDQLLSLQSVGDLLVGAVSADAVAGIIAEKGINAVGAIAGLVGLLDSDEQYIELIGYRGPSGSPPRALTRFPLSTSAPMTDAIRRAEPVWVESLADWKQRYPIIAAERPGEFRATVSLPLTINGRVTGSLSLTFRDDRKFGEPERLFMLLLARQCGQALERARLYQELAEREQRLADLVRRLLASQEEERRRLAYELHDGIAQVATATHQHLQVLASRLPVDSTEQREELQHGLQLAQRTVREARDLIRGLRPTVLDDFGLARAMLVEVEALQSEGRGVSLDERLGSGRLPPSIETALYRVLQEALNNIRKHAGPGRVQVSLRRRGNTVRLVVRDWGRGFNIEQQPRSDPARSAHIGLEAMEERISLLGGQFSIRSRPGRGTTVDVSVPVPQPWTVSRAKSA